MDKTKNKNKAASKLSGSQDRCPAEENPEDVESDGSDNGSPSTILDRTTEAEIGVEIENDGSQDDGVPYDKGWAWIVLCGCFLNYMLIAGYLKCLSLFYVEILHRYHAQATEAALLFSIRAGLFSVSSPFVMSGMVGRFGIRRTVVIGALVLSLSGILSSLVDHMIVIIIFTGGLLGLGHALVMSPGDVLIGRYFRKRRSLALGLAKCGSSFGNMLAPPLISFFLQTYGLFGTLLLTGGLCLHSFPAAFLFRPTSFYRKRWAKKKAVSAQQSELCKSPEQAEALIAKSSGDEAAAEREVTSQTEQVRLELSPDKEAETTAFERSKSISGATSKPAPETNDVEVPLVRSMSCKEIQPEHSQQQETMSVQRQNSSVSDELQEQRADTSTDHEAQKEIAVDELGKIPGQPASAVTKSQQQSGEDSRCTSLLEANRTSDTSDQRQRQSQVSKLFRKCCKIVFFMLDPSLFSLPLFRLLLAYFVLFSCLNMMVNYLPALATENGLSESQAALLLTIVGGLDLVCRLSSALLANSRLIKVSTMLAISFVIVGVTVQFVRFMTSWEHMVVLSVVLGLLGGVPNTTISMLVLDFVGLDKMSDTLGFVIFTLGACQAAFYPLLGYIRDYTGSYFVVYHVLGGGSLLAAGVLCCERWVRPLQEKKTDVSPANSPATT